MTASISGNSFPTPAATTTPQTAAPKASDATTLNQNFDQFLNLLTTQLKNQDPLSPMDSTQFTNQLVSFSGVEQQLKTNDNLSKLINLTNATQTTLGLGYIGLNIAMPGNKFDYSGSGGVTTAYNLPVAGDKSTLNITDANGNTVFSQVGETAAGTHQFTWDGKTNDGQAAPAGTYRFNVVSTTKDGNPIAASTTVPGYVTGISTNADGTTDLVVGKDSVIVPLSQVTHASL